MPPPDPESVTIRDVRTTLCLEPIPASRSTNIGPAQTLFCDPGLRAPLGPFRPAAVRTTQHDVASTARSAAKRTPSPRRRSRGRACNANRGDGPRPRHRLLGRGASGPSQLSVTRRLAATQIKGEKLRAPFMNRASGLSAPPDNAPPEEQTECQVLRNLFCAGEKA